MKYLVIPPHKTESNVFQHDDLNWKWGGIDFSSLDDPRHCKSRRINRLSQECVSVCEVRTSVYGHSWRRRSIQLEEEWKAPPRFLFFFTCEMESNLFLSIGENDIISVQSLAIPEESPMNPINSEKKTTSFWDDCLFLFFLSNSNDFLIGNLQIGRLIILDQCLIVESNLAVFNH